jgi:hypothetical protein
VALNKPYSEKVDIYSFGVILWQLASGVAPFTGTSCSYIHNIDSETIATL